MKMTHWLLYTDAFIIFYKIDFRLKTVGVGGVCRTFFPVRAPRPPPPDFKRKIRKNMYYWFTSPDNLIFLNDLYTYLHLVSIISNR